MTAPAFGRRMTRLTPVLWFQNDDDEDDDDDDADDDDDNDIDDDNVVDVDDTSFITCMCSICS